MASNGVFGGGYDPRNPENEVRHRVLLTVSIAVDVEVCMRPDATDEDIEAAAKEFITIGKKAVYAGRAIEIENVEIL